MTPHQRKARTHAMQTVRRLLTQGLDTLQIAKKTRKSISRVESLAAEVLESEGVTSASELKAKDERLKLPAGVTK